MAELLYTYDDPPSERHLAQARQVLEQGGLLSYSMGANWAFGCDARITKSVERVCDFKPDDKKRKHLALVCSSIKMASHYGHIDNALYRILKKVWPGPYTILVKSTLTLPKALKHKRQTVGLRVPSCRLVRDLIESYGSPLASSSVPLKEDESPFRFGYEIDEVFGHALDLILDLGDELSGQESTVIDFTEGYPEIIREGLGPVDIFS